MRSIIPKLLVVMILTTAPVAAQISPGDLSRAHQNLEGIANCQQCHETGRELSGAKCLACHTEIKAQVDAKH